MFLLLLIFKVHEKKQDAQSAEKYLKFNFWQWVIFFFSSLSKFSKLLSQEHHDAKWST